MTIPEKMMHKIHFKKALLPEGWTDNVELLIDNHRIVAVDTHVAVPANDCRQHSGYAVPGMTNVHSHAFQHAFAGLGEFRTARHDSFWTWRKLMYGFLEKLTPDDVYTIGKKLYAQMLRAGYSTVGEFHYLHHQPDGTPYDNVTEMANALIHAAFDVGMNICMLPVYYQRGGFDDSPLQGGQLRFGSTRDLFLRMIDQLQADWGVHPRFRLGLALHSLRAVSIPAAQSIIADMDQIIADYPIHIHVAEQTGEVDDCLQATGKRPVELLLDSFDVNQRWCLIHATHMTDDECLRVARSGAVAGVCPTTEANLGDGVFMAEDYLREKGRLAVGSDSHISVDACEELRLLEYAQRLTRRRRAVLCTDSQSCGSLLYDWASRGGAQVTGFGPAELRVGAFARSCVITLEDSGEIPVERTLDRTLFCSSPGGPRIEVISNETTAR